MYKGTFSKFEARFETKVSKKRGIFMLENVGVRMLVAESRLKYKDIAKYIGVTPEHLSKCMRYKLKPQMYMRIMTAIHDLRGDRVDDV